MSCEAVRSAGSWGGGSLIGGLVLVESFDDVFKLPALVAGNLIVLLAVMVGQGAVLLDETLAQFGGEGGLRHVQALALAHEHLFEVGRVAQYGLGAMVGFTADGLNGFALEDEFLQDDFLVGEGGSHVVNAAAGGQQFFMIFFPFAPVGADRAGTECCEPKLMSYGFTTLRSGDFG